jgi:POT family proton-dependent oligopeptide transporter
MQGKRPQQSSQGDWFGHPRGLTFLFGTEMWERFSYYGMRSLLVLYMVKYLLPEREHEVIGLSTLRYALEAIFGPLANQPFASQIYGLYTGLVYLTPVAGGFLADRVFGQRRMVIAGAALMAAGHFLMASERFYLFALTLLILGNGAFKPNISTQVGSLYEHGDVRRDRAFSIFYVGINLGAFLAPLVCGSLGEGYGWHYGFTAAGVGMTLGLIIYLAGAPALPKDAMLPRRGPKSALTKHDWQVIGSLFALNLPVSLYWATYEQQGNTIVLWADQWTEREVDWFGISATIPVTWFQALNPFMIFAFTPFVVWFWRWQGQREPSSVVKMAIGCALNAAALVLLALVAAASGDSKASWLWLAAYFVIMTVGELYLSPTSLSLVTKVAPLRLLSMMMGVWLATSFIGSLLAGYLGTFWSSMTRPYFFFMLALISIFAAVFVAAFSRPLGSALRQHAS